MAAFSVLHLPLQHRLCAALDGIAAMRRSNTRWLLAFLGITRSEIQLTDRLLRVQFKLGHNSPTRKLVIALLGV